MRVFSGQRAWLVQRASALVLLLFVVAVAVRLLLFGAPTAAQWRDAAATPHGAVLIVIAFIALCSHAWVGVRDVVLDYVHPPAMRLALLAVVALLLMGVLTRVLLTLTVHFRG